MFNGFLDKQFYGNTVSDWLIALAIVLGAIIIGKIMYWFMGNVVKKLTKKTKTKLDDILVDMLEEPLVFAIIIIGLWFSLQTLQLSEDVRLWIDKVYYVLIIINVAWLITRVFDSLVKEYLVPLVSKTEGDLDDQLLPIIRKGIKMAVWVIAIIVALNNAGYDVGAVLAGLGIGGLAFALAAKDSVANLFGGFTIFVDKPFTVNDRIAVSGFDGTIQEIGLRSTRLRTLAGRLVTIPNASIANHAIENISSEPSRKVVLNLGLTYDMDDEAVESAMKLLKEIAAENNSIEENISIAFNNFGDFALNILFIYYIKKESDILKTQTEMNLEILRKFSRNKLEFAFPSQTIYTKQG